MTDNEKKHIFTLSKKNKMKHTKITINLQINEDDKTTRDQLIKAIESMLDKTILWITYEINIE